MLLCSCSLSDGPWVLMLLLSLAQADRILFVDRLGNMEPGCVLGG